MRQLEVSVSHTELEAALVNNTELFSIDMLGSHGLESTECLSFQFVEKQAVVRECPICRLILSVEPVPLKRSLDRIGGQCGCGLAPAAGRIVGGQGVNPAHSRPYQVPPH